MLPATTFKLLKNAGFALASMPEAGGCLYQAVALQLASSDAATLRQIVAVNLEYNLEQYQELIALAPGTTVADYIANIKNTDTLAGDLEISILMKILNRPIFIVGPTGAITNLQILDAGYIEQPIFVYYDGVGHYDGLVLRNDFTAAKAISTLMDLQPAAKLEIKIPAHEEEKEEEPLALFIKAIENNDYPAMAKCISTNDQRNPADDSYMCTMILAAAKGDLEGVIACCDKISPNTCDNLALIAAAANGHLDVVHFLSMQPEVDPAARDNFALIAAAVYGRLDVVQFLSQCPGINLGVSDNNVIIFAAGNGHLPVVQFLSKSDSVNPAANDNEPIRVAAAHGHLEVVRFLSTLQGVDPAANDNEAYRMAVQNKHLHVERFLLKLQQRQAAMLAVVTSPTLKFSNITKLNAIATTIKESWGKPVDVDQSKTLATRKRFE